MVDTTSPMAEADTPMPSRVIVRRTMFLKVAILDCEAERCACEVFAEGGIEFKAAVE